MGICLPSLPEPSPEFALSADGCALESVFFAYNDSTLDEQARRALQRDAVCLARNPATRYLLLGRGDPRGTPDSNRLLGEQRATAVLRYLAQAGLALSRFAVEGARTVGTGVDESSFRFDRRVDFVPAREPAPGPRRPR